MIPQSVPSTVRGARGGARGPGRKHPPRQPSTGTVGKKAPTQQATSPRLTHFLALPIGHHAGLCELMERFGQSLLSDTNPPISGLDESVLVSPRRLHFTLGVMSLASTSSATGGIGPAGPVHQPHTVDDAVRFLQSLKPRVEDILRAPVSGSAHQAQKIRVALNSMDVMKLDRGGAAHVLWVGPKGGNSKDTSDEETNKFRQVCDFIHSSFKKAGFLAEDRPLKLHCTIVNTVYRKPRPRGGKRVPFTYTDLLRSPWFCRPENSIPSHEETTQRLTQSTSSAGNHPPRSPVSVDFGTWDIDEVQICEMGSFGPEGEYVCVGKIDL